MTHAHRTHIRMQADSSADKTPPDSLLPILGEPIGKRNSYFGDLDPLLQQLDDEPVFDDQTDDLPMPPEEDPPLFVHPPQATWFRPADLDETFAPITDEEAALLREKIPRRLANFFLQRADDAVRLRSRRDPADKSFIGRLLNDLPPSAADRPAADSAELRDYVFVTTVGPPDFRRTGSRLFGGADGFPESDDYGLVGRPYVDELTGEPIVRPALENAIQPRLVSLFVGNIASVDEQASRIGNGILAIFTLYVLIKVASAAIAFFFNFSFSFFAIFALSSGLFVVFVLLRF